MKKLSPSLSLKERDRRWSHTRELMKEKGVECLIVPGLKGREELDGYLSNEDAEGIVIFPFNGKPIHLTWTATRITRHIESVLRDNTPWVEDMRVGLNGPTLVEVLKEKGFEKGRIGVVGIESKGPAEPEGLFPYKTWSYVLKELPQATFIEISDAFYEMVLIKSEEELTLVRHSAQIGEKACKKMLEMVKPGLDERDLYASIVEVIFKAGAHSPPPFLILHSGLENLSWGPPMWYYQGGKTQTFKKGDLVMAEIFPRYGGMESQQQMAVHLKPENPVIVELARIARRSYELGLATLRVGATFQEVCEAMTGPILKAGCWHLTPLIHSLNPMGVTSKCFLGIDQLPGIQNYKGVKETPIAKGNLVIQPNMVFELEPNVCRGKYRVNIGGSVIVTKEGVEELNNLPTKMRILN